ncbi:MAG TPA: alpha/beta fold hydrolase [Gaiellaceae bacterium]|nr:alpha/beta fold hydrolase [Gaiellaceae bacterium]
MSTEHLAEYGDPDGTPVIYLHGGGDSRLTVHPDEEIARRLGVRVLALERSGKAARRRTLRAWADETVAAIPVERFGVVGWSAGGPHALALAAVAPERVTRVALVGSMPPPDLVHLLAADVQKAVRVSGIAPRLAVRGLEQWGRLPTPPTGSPETDAAYARGRVEGFRAGGLWLARELAYLGKPWGFELADVKQPVTLWWGTQDETCLPAIADTYLERLPNAELRLVEGTHQVLFPYWGEILASAAA